MSWTTMEGWGGRVWVSESGRRTFYIRQVRGGKRWDVSTRCSTLRGALKELERFEQAPEHYRPSGSGEGAVVLNEALIERYAQWCREHTDAQDPRWLEAKKRYLMWWAECFDLRPLTNMKLSLVLQCLDGQVSRADRIKSLKHLYSWLRQTDQIIAADDPTLSALPVPQSRPEQDTGESKVIPEADFRAVLPTLPPMLADICRVLAGTGCHLSEVLRLMKSGAVEEREEPKLPVLSFKHKGGHTHRVEVQRSVADAAKRILGLEAPGRTTVYRAIQKACRAAGVEPWTPGRFRHTFATNAIARGVPPAAVALALGHTSSPTTLKWYATTAVAPAVDGFRA